MARKSSTKPLMVVAILIAVIGIGGAVFALTMDSETETARQNSSEPTAEEMGMTEEEHANMDKTDDNATVGSTVIVFTNDGFERQSYTSKAGEAVTVRNDSDIDLEFSSDDHPTHRDNPELNMDVLGAGESGTFTPDGAGTYEFHDHINDQYTGTLTVE